MRAPEDLAVMVHAAAERQLSASALQEYRWAVAALGDSGASPTVTALIALEAAIGTAVEVPAGLRSWLLVLDRLTGADPIVTAVRESVNLALDLRQFLIESAWDLPGATEPTPADAVAMLYAEADRVRALARCLPGSDAIAGTSRGKP